MKYIITPKCPPRANRITLPNIRITSKDGLDFFVERMIEFMQVNLVAQGNNEFGRIEFKVRSVLTRTNHAS